MERTALLVAAILPAFVLLAYGRAKTRADWSSEALWSAFMLGGVGAIAAIIIEIGPSLLAKAVNLSPLGYAAAEAYLVAGLIEEAVKFAILIGVAEKHVDRRRAQDIVMVALAVSLGLAAIENIFYVTKSQDWQGLAMARAMTAVPGHGLFGLVMGALLAAARIWPDRTRAWIAAALIVPVAMHGSYDFPLFAVDADRWWGWEWIWNAIFVGCATLAIATCNWVLPSAALVDRLGGHESQSIDVRPLWWTIAILLLLASLFMVAPYFMPWRSSLARMGMLGFLPLLFALDLLWSVRRQKRETRSSRDALTAR